MRRRTSGIMRARARPAGAVGLLLLVLVSGRAAPAAALSEDDCPTAALLALGQLKSEQLASSERRQLDALLALESTWLDDARATTALQAALQRAGWSLSQERWQESLRLPLDQPLIERWLGEGRPYRRRLDASGAEASACGPLLRRWLEAHRGRALPQRLCHLRLSGERSRG